jgi:hypothetical protein
MQTAHSPANRPTDRARERALLFVAGRAVLLYKVVASKVALKVVFNGRAGWLGLGVENLVGGHGGMLGAPAVLALLESADAAPEDNFVANIGTRLAQRTPTQPAHAA